MSIHSKAAIRVFVGSVLAAGYIGATLAAPAGFYDEGLIVTGATRILHGQLPYRDFDTGYPPGQFYTIAGVFSVLGTNLLAERVWDTVWRLAIVGLCVLLAREASLRKSVHPVPLICACIVTGGWGWRLYPMIVCVLPCLAAVWCAVQYLQQRAVRWLFFSGIWAGAAILYRHDLAACVCGAVTLATCYQALAEGNRRWLQPVAVFWGGVMAVAAIPVLSLWLAVPHDALVRAFIDFPRITFAGRHLPMPGPGSAHAWLISYFPLTVVVVAGVTFRLADSSRKPTLALLLMTGAFPLTLATQRLDAAHAYPAIMFSLVLLCASMAAWKPGERRGLRLLLLSGAIFLYGLVPLGDWSRLMAELRQAGTSGNAALGPQRDSRNDPPYGIERAGPVILALDQRQAVCYIQRNLGAGKPLYVGGAVHDRSWYNDAMFYFLAERPPATRFDMFAPGLTTNASVQAEILRDVRQKQVEYVVLFRVPASKEQNLSAVGGGVHILDDAIHQEYVQVAEFGRYTIWHRKSA